MLGPDHHHAQTWPPGTARGRTHEGMERTPPGRGSDAIQAGIGATRRGQGTEAGLDLGGARIPLVLVVLQRGWQFRHGVLRVAPLKVR